jgi:CBS domain containing-hemolysin-like protein
MLDYAWLMALMCFFISSGWAAGDVSLSAYIQSSLDHAHFKNITSPLSAVMAFLYTTYIVVYACLSFGLGKVIDKYVKQGNPKEFLFWISGVMMSIASFIIFCSSFIPKGSFALNPTPKQLGVKVEEEEGSPERTERNEEMMSPVAEKRIIHAITAKTDEVELIDHNGQEEINKKL